jgi:hypothetical protein
MSDYLRELKALDWLNTNTDYKVNNVSEDYPKHQKVCGGLFVVSKFSAFRTGKELIKIAEWEGWVENE